MTRSPRRPTRCIQTLVGKLKAESTVAGTPIGLNDLLIAAHALALDVCLVTANEREFRRIPNLNVVNWTIEP